MSSTTDVSLRSLCRHFTNAFLQHRMVWPLWSVDEFTDPMMKATQPERGLSKPEGHSFLQTCVRADVALLGFISFCGGGAFIYFKNL